MQRLKAMRFLLISALFAPGFAAAQSLSVADLQRQIDTEIDKGSEYKALLNDPDARRAQAAMKVMLGSGDPYLISVALDYGLYSPDPGVRGAAVKGLLDGKPWVDIFLFMTDANNGFQKSMDYMFKTVPNADGVASVPIPVSGYDQQRDCYLSDTVANSSHSGRCFLQIRPEVVRVNLAYGWSEVRLNDDGALIGEVKVSSGQMSPIRIQLH
jgi:hypothetical protein